jgi:hypothetical protein
VLRSVARGSSDIAYGEVRRGNYRRGARFRVIHVYKGSLRPGRTVDADVGWGLDAPPCAGMMVPPPVVRGRRGVIFFSGSRPTMNFLDDDEVAQMFSLGLLEPGPHDRAGARPR